MTADQFRIINEVILEQRSKNGELYDKYGGTLVLSDFITVPADEAARKTLLREFENDGIKTSSVDGVVRIDYRKEGV